MVKVLPKSWCNLKHNRVKSSKKRDCSLEMWNVYNWNGSVCSAMSLTPLIFNGIDGGNCRPKLARYYLAGTRRNQQIPYRHFHHYKGKSLNIDFG